MKKFNYQVAMEKKQCSEQNLNIQNKIFEQIQQSIQQLCQYYEQQLEQYSFPEVNAIQYLTQRNDQLTIQVQMLESKLQLKEEEKVQLEQEKQASTQKQKKLSKFIKELKVENSGIKERCDDLEFDCQVQDEQNQKLSKENSKLKDVNYQNNKKIQDLQIKLMQKDLEIENIQNNYNLNLQKIRGSDVDDAFKNQIVKKMHENKSLKSFIAEQQQQLEDNYLLLYKQKEDSEIIIQTYEKQVLQEKKQVLFIKEEVTKCKIENQLLKAQIIQKDKQIKEFQISISKFKYKIKQLYNENQSFQDYLNLKEDEYTKHKKTIEQLQTYFKNHNFGYNDDLIKSQQKNQQMENNDFDNLQQQLTEIATINLDEFEREKENQMKKMIGKEQQSELEQQELYNSNKTLVKKLISKATEVQGQLDICIVLDITSSMEPYIQYARKCVRESLKMIKFQTNRDTNVSAVCYYDIEQKSLTKTGFYHQLDFTKDAQVLEIFLDQMKTAGGRDTPEDVKGAFDQMLTNITWKNKFRLAILITDAPCHGEKYHEPMNDYHKDSDITETLHNIVKNGIILIGFNLNQRTTLMFKEFEKVYKEIQKQDYFSMVDIQEQQIDELAKYMTKTLVQASEQVTQVKNTGTKLKKTDQGRPKNNDGAMEALYKQGSFYNFEKQENVKVVDANFKVLKVEIVDQIFEENFQTINNIGKRQDHYKITDEGLWQCVRTDQPFAFGMMKDVFLMKKKNAMKDELFVIKTPVGSQPYKTQNDAIYQCRSHLICQKLVKKFQDEIEDVMEGGKYDLNIPLVKYSDFVILEETNNRFWIAEKIYKGEFIKYNNNFGYINPYFNPLNQFAQAFSYYTFFISGGKFLVNDVQGVGNYFTDPAINTETGDFDDTDLGLEGQQMFLVSFEWRKYLVYDYLNILNISYE